MLEWTNPVLIFLTMKKEENSEVGAVPSTKEDEASKLMSIEGPGANLVLTLRR